MLSLLATCYLASQFLFVVPDGWRVTEVYTGGDKQYISGSPLILTYCSRDCEEQKKKAYMKLVRDLRPGETVEAPPGCTLTLNSGTASVGQVK